MVHVNLNFDLFCLQTQQSESHRSALSAQEAESGRLRSEAAEAEGGRTRAEAKLNEVLLHFMTSSVILV